MKIPFHQLQSGLTIDISGNEEWLASIYSTFPMPHGVSKPLITGHLALKMDALDPKVVNVTGAIHYEPFVDCSRCADPIRWPIKTELSARFVHAIAPKINPEDPLSQGDDDDDDEYYFTGDDLDLEPMLNDRIQTAIPMQTIKKSADLSKCTVCGLSLLQEKVYSDEERASKSPFEILADLKLKQ